MTSTGVHSHEQSPKSESRWLSPFLRAGACGLALTAGVLGLNSTAQAEHTDLTKPRIEKVKDVDGSVWEVLIVPRPLYRPAPFHCPPDVSSKATPTKPAPVVPSPAPYDDAKPEIEKPKEKPKAKTPAPTPPPPPQKQTPMDEKTVTLPQPTEWVALDDKEEKEADGEKKTADPMEKAKNDFGVEIVPRFSYPKPMLGSADDCCPMETFPTQVHPNDYWRVYRSIPFLRSEYIANPSYRHDATMEILLGQLRPTVGKQQAPQPRPHHTLFPFENNFYRPNSYYALGPGAGPGYGPSLGLSLSPSPYPAFGMPGTYGMNYPGAQLSRVPWGVSIPFDLTPGY